ncbi:MAG: biotin--[acetyl-CoA-carboxylase] ligase [Nevskia sp.]|nr:biotin--[acetyl-CoA-carboxylase] ligase [Nevskia sp.]
MARTLSEDELLRLIDGLAAGAWTSGEALAAASGVTRAALARRVAHLREWGLEVEAEAGRGYRLLQPLQRLDAARIQAALPVAVRQRLHGPQVLARVDSTNQRLLEAAPAQDPQALLAELQTAGRGRRGRSWRSPFGANLYLSLAWSFAEWPPQLSALSLAVGVACARAVRSAGVEQVMLKWPNDLRVGAAKLGGILIEQRGEAGGHCRVIVGIGLNVAMSEQQAGPLDQPWTSMQAALGDRGAPDRNSLAAALLAELVAALELFEAQGFAPFVADWSRLDAAAGQPVLIESGGNVIEGTGCGIDEQGALIVESQGTRHHLHAGEVSLRLQPRP